MFRLSGKLPMIRLDGRVLKMLAILQREGRIPKAALADRIARSPTPCGDRLKRLEDAGLISGYGAFVAPNAFGPVHQVFTQVELEDHRADSFARFERAVVPLDAVMAVWALGGGFDYLVHFAVPTIDVYQQTIDGLLDADIGHGSRHRQMNYGRGCRRKSASASSDRAG